MSGLLRESFLVADAQPEGVFTPEDFNADQLAYGEAARNFMKKEVLPVAERIEAKEPGLMRALIGRAGEMGLLMADVPEEYGGLALDKVTAALIAQNVSEQASFMTAMNGHTGIGMLPIIYYGSPELKARYLPEMAEGKKIGCYALTEPGAGSDALACKTRAVLSEDGKRYLLNGTKQFITNAGFADVFIVFAKVDGKHFTGFVVDRDTPGLSTGPEEHKLGLHGSSTTTVLLEDVSVPVSNMLGELGKGHKIAFNVLNMGRFKVGTQSTGQAKAAFSSALEYTLLRRQFGRRIAEFGAVREKLAMMYARIYGAEAISYRTIGAIDLEISLAGASNEEKLKAIERYAVECAMVKVYGSETLCFVADEALQCFGGYGYCAEYPAERHYRDARITRIYEGTNEINRVLIATTLLRRYKEGGLDLSTEFPGAGRGEALPILKAAANLKRLFRLVFVAASEAHGEALLNRQMELTRLSDLLIASYVAESAALRAVKDSARRGADRASLPLAAARVVCQASLDEALPLARRLLEGCRKENLLPLAAELCDVRGLVSLEALEEIASRLVEAERFVI